MNVLTTSQSRPAPIYLTDLCKLIKANGGTIWTTGKADYGFWVLADVTGRQIRFIMATKSGQPIPYEREVITHVVSTFDGLHNFLADLLAKAPDKVTSKQDQVKQKANGLNLPALGTLRHPIPRLATPDLF